MNILQTTISPYKNEKTCLTCNNKFFTPRERKFCSCSCYWKSLKGKPSKRKNGIYKNCIKCNKQFYVQKLVNKIGKGNYCSKKCFYLSKRKRKTTHCKVCNQSIVIRPSQEKEGKGQYCSPFCSVIGKIGKYKKNKCHFWKGGVTPINMLIRKSREYKLWRKTVFERDNYTCVWCNYKGGNLNADHIKPFSLYPKLRFLIDNGRTLCSPCHRTTETFGSKMRKYHLTKANKKTTIKYHLVLQV